MRELRITISVPTDAESPPSSSVALDELIIQRICQSVEAAVRDRYPDASYVEHEIREQVAS